MTSGIGMSIDGVVSILLVITIGYCTMLNRRLKLLKADEQSLRATISELVTATEIAERAVGGLKLTVHECDMGLGERLRKAERICIDIDSAVASGKDVLGRLSQIVTAGRRPEEPSIVAPATTTTTSAPAAMTAKEAPAVETRRSDAKAVAAAAEAFAAKVRMKIYGRAA